MESRPNPYEPPRATGRDEPQWSTTFQAELVRWSWLYRRFLVTGPCPCTIVYNGWGLGYETVWVDDQIACRMGGRFFTVAPRLEFTLSSPAGTFAGRVEVRMRLESFIAGLRLVINDEIVYSEGSVNVGYRERTSR